MDDKEVNHVDIKWRKFKKSLLKFMCRRSISFLRYLGQLEDFNVDEVEEEVM